MHNGFADGYFWNLVRSQVEGLGDRIDVWYESLALRLIQDPVSGVILGVVLLRLIFVGLTFLGIDANMQYIIKGLIILIACAIDMRKYLVRR